MTRYQVIAEDEQDLSWMTRKVKEEYEDFKCEYLAAGHNECNDLKLENDVIKGVQLCKSLGPSLRSKEIEIKDRTNQKQNYQEEYRHRIGYYGGV
ncbi:hypothetical protein HUJ04_008348 [Dendroctonus ponderosae]|nr:hypothetical protein HUJ04_008348 [Dendroctonus ponderosae]